MPISPHLSPKNAIGAAVNAHDADGTSHADIRASVVSAITESGTNADAKIATHNASTAAHADIRTLISGLGLAVVNGSLCVTYDDGGQ